MLEDENRKLKTLVAHLALDKSMLQEVLSKRGLKPTQRRVLDRFLRVGFAVSERRVCHVLRLQRAMVRYRSHAKDQTPLRIPIRDLALARGRYG